MKRFLVFLSLALIFLAVRIPSAQAAEEFRELYVDAFHPGIKSHAEVTQMVQAAKSANFNALIVQVRKRGDAYYNSHIEPKASDIDPKYDPLADVIKQAHALGLEVHAMISTFEVSHESYTLAENHICKTHPEWLMMLKDGSTTQYGKVYLDPCVPQVQDYLISVVADIARNYAVDGIHLEGCRYSRIEAMYNKISLDSYKLASGSTDTPKCNDLAWCDWRRQQVTSLVRKMKASLAEARPSARLSAAVTTPSATEASGYCLQDWDKWMNDGLLDFAVPMLYDTKPSISAGVVKNLNSEHGRHMYIGIGTWQLDGDAATQHIRDARSAGARGVVLFNYHYLADAGGKEKRVRFGNLSTEFNDVASLPGMTWR